MAKRLHFDCFSGIAGDMALAALIDLGVPEATVRSALDSLGLEGTLKVEKIKKHGLAATRVVVETAPTQKHRHLKHVHEIIDRGALTEGARRRAREMFGALAAAEAACHNSTIEKVHFHEVGAVDSIFDFVGVAVALDWLGVEAISASAVPTGCGTVRCEHGLMPVPAPATARLLEGIPLAACDLEAELTTPTGAAILKTQATSFGALPPQTLSGSGFGAGTRDLPDRPNVLRVLLGESSPTALAAADVVVKLETNLDHVSGEVIGHTVLRLFAAGALEVFCVPIQMKKLRPGVILTVLCDPEMEIALSALMFAELGTLGIRKTRMERALLIRKSCTVDTPLGPIGGKLAWDGAKWRFAPEADECVRVAVGAKVPFRDVQYAARAAFALLPPMPPPT